MSLNIKRLKGLRKIHSTDSSNGIEPERQKFKKKEMR
jgi:hypothetical protein